MPLLSTEYKQQKIYTYINLPIIPETKNPTNVGLNCSLAACFANNQIKSEYQKYLQLDHD